MTDLPPEAAAAESAAEPGPITMSIAVQMSPLWRYEQPGVPFAGPLEPFAEQMTGYLVKQLEGFGDPRGADLFVAVAIGRDGQTAAHEYRSGHYVKEPEAAEPADRPAGTGPEAQS